MIEDIKSKFCAQADILAETGALLAPEIGKAVDTIVGCLRQGGQVITFGNGGSAADAQHFVCELAGRFLQERQPLKAVCLNTNVSSITAIGNDYGYEEIFLRQLQGICEKRDVIVGISTSGKSANVNRALSYGNQAGAVTIGLTGKDGGDLKKLASISLHVPLDVCPRIQEIHIMVCHIICEWVERKMLEC